MILPMIVIASSEALRQVPPSIRDGSLALGATRWQTVWNHTLPGAIPGIMTGTILAVSRAAGEAAVLILVGAPVAFADHVQRALAMAKAIRADTMALIERWSGSGLSLGVGVGVASGFVTVGVIGGASRLEYTAVGPAVNLASRLCSEAAHAEVLIDQRTSELLDAGARQRELRPGEALRLKGYEQPVQSYVLAAA